MANFDLKLIPEYDGTSDFSCWYEKVELVCGLQKPAVDLAVVVPLRLTGGASAVYRQLSEADKADAGKVKAALQRAFAVDKFKAYEEFRDRQLRVDESVDVFLADLQRLSSIFGGINEEGLSCVFVAGLPESVRHALQTGARMESLSLSEMVDRARAILCRDSVLGVAAAADHRGPRRQEATVCYACGQPNHLARDCLRGRGGRGRRGGLGGSRLCFRCSRPGHVAATCPENGGGEVASAPASSPAHQ